MIRKWLFLGLTLMLAAVVITLLIKGRQEEKNKQEAALHPVEVVRVSKPSLTRIIGPKEIVVSEQSLDMSPAATSSGESSRMQYRHKLVLRNTGRLACRNLRIRIVYYGRGEKVLETTTKEMADTLPPGEQRSLEFVVEDLPKGAIKADARVLSADLERPVSGAK
jgi:hypothetical protein